MGFLLQLMETRHYAIMTEDINDNLYVILTYRVDFCMPGHIYMNVLICKNRVEC